MSRPVMIPRSRLSPLGKVLAERDISARALGEALAIAEERGTRVETQLVNRWIWAQSRPSSARRLFIARILQVPIHELFPPPPKKPRRRPPKPSPTAAEQQLLDRAEELGKRSDEDLAAARRHLIRAVSQERIPESTDSAAIPSIDYQAQKRARPIPGSPQRRAA